MTSEFRHTFEPQQAAAAEEYVKDDLRSPKQRSEIATMKSRTTPTEFRSVDGLPTSATLYRMPASPYWQFRIPVRGGHKRKSTKETDLKKAQSKAKKIFKEWLLMEHAGLSLLESSFESAARDFIIWQEGQVAIGSIGRRTHQEDVYILNAYVLPFFGRRDLSSVNRKSFDLYFASLNDHKFAKSTLNKHLIVLRKILNLAFDRDIIKSLPRFPSIGVDHNARPYFDLESYLKLSQKADEYAKNNHIADHVLGEKAVRKLKYTIDFSSLIDFHINSFLRISDLKQLRHEHVQILRKVEGQPVDGLSLIAPFPKSRRFTGVPSVTLEKALNIYETLREWHKASGFGRPKDFVFFPEHENRDYALDVMARLFSKILDDLGIKSDPSGRTRTLYSLRHTAIMYRFLYGKSEDIFLLAQNAQTSVEILERHYLSHAKSIMKAEELQEWKNPAVHYCRLSPPITVSD